MLSRALFLAQATTALAAALVLTHAPHPTTAARVAARPVTAGLVSGTSAVQPVRRAPAPRQAVTRGAAKRVVVRTAPPRARRATTPSPPRGRVTARPVALRQHAAGALTTQQRMQQAVARIPGYRAGGASWVLSTRYGSWGTADWYHDRVYVSPNVPASRMYDVVSHEWSHLLSVQDYAGNVDAATAAMNRWFGGSDLTGAERAADCMAKQLGAVWTHYTSCGDAHWREGARLLLSGQPLPE
jgi:hypothetical protein